MIQSRVLSNNIHAFLALVRGGLWENDVHLSQYGSIDSNEILRLSEEQSVVGLVATGIEHVVDVKFPQEVVLQIVGQTLQIEQRNSAMNLFIADIVDKMRDVDIDMVLVKGQGVAHCYERPQWRSSGDIDFLLSDTNYQKAVDSLLPLSSYSKFGGQYSKEFAVTIQGWIVELHGSLRTGLSSRVDKAVDEVQKDVFYGGNVRSWNNSGTTVFLPAPDNDVFFVFTHFIKHFYKEGMNLRQICDWIRLLWTFRDTINKELLKIRLQNSGLMQEWNGFSSLAVDYLCMPQESMPLFDPNCYAKGKRLVEHVLRGSTGGVIRDTWSIAKIYPLHTLKFLPAIFFNINEMKIKERVLGNDY